MANSRRLESVRTAIAAPRPKGRPAVPPAVPRGSGAAVVTAHLAEHVRRMRAYDPLVRADADDAVHQMRVATRRLRSSLATFRPLFDRGVTDPLRDELQWLGEVLGAARDAEVIRDRLRELVAAEPGDLVLGPVQARIVTTLGTRYRAAHDAVLAELDGPRYAALLASLDRLLADPPLTPAARRPAGRVLRPLVARTWQRMCRLHDAVLAVPSDDVPRRDAALHELRKAAKRARYAGEAMVPAHGRPARRWAARMESVQEVLGTHQDTVVIRTTLRELGVAAHLDGENAFTYGRLHALEQARAEAGTVDHRPQWERAADPRLHRWLHS